MCDGRICSLENETSGFIFLYTMYLFVERGVLLIYQMYKFHRRKTNATMSTQCVHDVQE